MKTIFLALDATYGVDGHSLSFRVPTWAVGKTCHVDIKKISGSGTFSASTVASVTAETADHGTAGVVEGVSTTVGAGDQHFADVPLYPVIRVDFTVITAALNATVAITME